MAKAEHCVYVIGHRSPDTDSICSAIAHANLKNCLGESNVRPARAGEPDAETSFVLKTFAVPVPDLLTDATGLDLILVDHNETGQALPYIERANILEIWEHHRIGDLKLPKPIVFHCEPVGATATLIAKLYFAHAVTPARAMAGLMLASILSGTFVFRSPTVSSKDRALAARLSALAEVDITAFGEQLLRIKSAAVEAKSPNQIVRDDFKEFLFGTSRVGIAQIQVMRAGAFAEQKADILREMRALRESNGLTQIARAPSSTFQYPSNLKLTRCAFALQFGWRLSPRRYPAFQSAAPRRIGVLVLQTGCARLSG